MDFVRSFYDGIPKTSQQDNEHVNQIRPYLLPKPGGNLLDIGCYDGEKTIVYKSAIKADTVWGVEFSADRLAEAVARGVRPVNADLNVDLPLDLEPASFDAIICSEVIEHVFSPDELLDEIARLLKPGGYVLLTTPNLASWKNRIVLMLGWQPFATEVSTRRRYGNPFAPAGHPAGHIRLFTLPALCEMAQMAGLRVARSGGLGLPSPQRNIIGGLSRAGDAILTRFPALADRLIVRMEKK